MEIEIRRYNIKMPTCDGHLYIDGRYVCDTSEHAYFRTAPGRYHLRLGYDDRQQHRVPLLIQHRVMRHYPMITWGCGVQKLYDGQIIVGRHHLHGVVLDSHDTFLDLLQRFNMAQRRNHTIHVTIIEL